MISRSALVLAGRRALAYEQGQSIFRDQYAKLFINEEIYEFVKKTDEEIHGMLLRTRCIEDSLLANIDKISCVINLGSGLDTKYQRLEKLKNIQYIDFDKKNLLEFKDDVLKKNNLPTSDYYFSETMDFKNLLEVVYRCSPESTPFIMAEGFFMYWPKETLNLFVDLISKYFKNDIYFSFDHHCDGIAQMQKSADIQSRLRKTGEDMISTYNPEDVITLLKNSSFTCDIYRPSDLCQKYYNKSWREHNEKYTCISIRHS